MSGSLEVVEELEGAGGITELFARNDTQSDYIGIAFEQTIRLNHGSLFSIVSVPLKRFPSPSCCLLQIPIHARTRHQIRRQLQSSRRP